MRKTCSLDTDNGMAIFLFGFEESAQVSCGRNSAIMRKREDENNSDQTATMKDG